MKTIAAIGFAGLLFGAVASADDLDEWQVVVPPSTFLSLLDVTYAAGTFVVVGETSTFNGVAAEIFTSRDGTHWTRRLSNMPGALFATAHGPNGFVSVGELIVTSPDGVHWTRRSGTIPLFDVCYGNGNFVAVGQSATILTSPDGLAWADRSLRPVEPWFDLLGVTSGDGRFVAVGYAVSEAGHNVQAVIVTSTNGVQWTRRSFLPPRLWDVAYGNGQFVAVGESDVILRSTNGVNWTRSASGINGHHFSITFHEGRFISVGYPGTVISSVDGANWKIHRTGPESLYGIAYGNGTYVAVDYDGAILRTPPPNAPPLAVVEVSPAAEFFSAPPEYAVISPNGLNARVTLSGAGSSDPDGDVLNFLWLRHGADGSITEIARTEQTTVVLPLGQHNFTLRVSDGVAEDAHEFQVHAITASEALGNVAALVEQSDLARRHKQPLLMLLRSAQRPFEDSDIGSGLHHLDRLQRKLDAGLRTTNPELAQSLTAALNDIRAAFEVLRFPKP